MALDVSAVAGHGAVLAALLFQNNEIKMVSFNDSCLFTLSGHFWIFRHFHEVLGRMSQFTGEEIY